MAVYFLLNRESTSFYELGSGRWQEVLPHLKSKPKELKKIIAEKVLHGIDDGYASIPDITIVTKELKKFAKAKNPKNIVLLGDSTDEDFTMRGLGYVCTGSRVGDPQNQNYHMTEYGRMLFGYFVRDKSAALTQEIMPIDQGVQGV